MATGAGAAAAAGAAARAAKQARRLLVGGLLVETPEETFRELTRDVEGLVLTGVKGSLRKKRLYLMPLNGVTFYCTTSFDRQLPIDAIDVSNIDDGPLGL